MPRHGQAATRVGIPYAGFSGKSPFGYMPRPGGTPAIGSWRGSAPPAYSGHEGVWNSALGHFEIAYNSTDPGSPPAGLYWDPVAQTWLQYGPGF